ncbi:M1 family metallopeptidase [Parafilimonas sp.]|uniref:M1 family metallopeptidase n=1 Tax=Parafilimonas sp. TaxID=1969739 RepID=UPI0039E5A745
MTRICLLCILITLSNSFISAQDLYMPRNIKNAYTKGTRALTGAPGPDYWQNKGVYDINVTVHADTKSISGTEKIVYSNNSPDTLSMIAIRFVNNIHKPNAPRSGMAGNDFLDSGLHIASFKIDGTVYDINSDDWGTVNPVKLKSAMMPHSNATLEIEWSYPLSRQSGREGQIDSTTFYCAYSYPRVSVYDDYNGWDMIPHTDRQEFYNDFNDYTLNVTAPKNFVVWATGDFLNPDEVLQPAIAQRLKTSYTSDSVIQIAGFDEMQQGKITQQNEWNTWKFKADHITDVCFGTSKNYVWDAASVIVDPENNRRASVQSAYNDTAKDFHAYTRFAQHALRYFSTQWPGVPYPFSKMTSFQGYADMEYPMMINDGTTDNLSFAQLVADHEIAHTYFPFYMGINETRYAFMDEGWATTWEYIIGIEENGKTAADNFYKSFRIRRYINDPSTEEDQPIISMSTQVSGAGYGNNSYGKASLSYLALKDLLGDDLFKKALHHYMDNWNGRHPIPWDYFYSINTGAGQNLNWFWNNWFFSNNYLDLKINNVQLKNNKTTITIQNVGGFAIPFNVIATDKNGRQTTQHFTPAVWSKNDKTITVTIDNKAALSAVKLDGGIFMDATPGDNEYKL